MQRNGQPHRDTRYAIEARLHVANVPAFVVVLGFAESLEAAQQQRRELERAASWQESWRGIRLRIWE